MTRETCKTHIILTRDWQLRFSRVHVHDYCLFYQKGIADNFEKLAWHYSDFLYLKYQSFRKIKLEEGVEVFRFHGNLYFPRTFLESNCIKFRLNRPKALGIYKAHTNRYFIIYIYRGTVKWKLRIVIMNDFFLIGPKVIVNANAMEIQLSIVFYNTGFMLIHKYRLAKIISDSSRILESWG